MIGYLIERLTTRGSIKYLTTQGVNFHLENLLKNAKSRIILITPYIKFQRRIKEILREQKTRGTRIDIVCRKADLKEDIREFATNIFDAPTLHAKCYINEREAILTSLNLYEFSQQNNEEMGVYIENKGAGKKLYSEIMEDASLRFCKTIHRPEVKIKPDLLPLRVGEKYTTKELDDIFNFQYKKPAGIKDIHGSEDLVLFSYSKGPYGNEWKNNVLYYRGQNTGTKPQSREYGNKKLWNAYKNQNIKLHLFEDNVYSGLCTIVKEPYMEKGKWIFPLALLLPPDEK